MKEDKGLEREGLGWRKRHLIMFILIVFGIDCSNTWAQSVTISGKVLDSRIKKPLGDVRISIDGLPLGESTSVLGAFKIQVDCNFSCILQFAKEGYTRVELPIEVAGEPVELGVIFLSRINPVEKQDVLLNLSETDLDDEEGISDVVGLLQGSQDVFLNRAAFDFSQSFFRVRGYDSSEGRVHINGLPMNNLFDGRPQWNHWGGLNDIMRYATRSMNLEVSRTSFEALMGGVDFTIRPSKMRPGTRLTSSWANRGYSTRFMITHASGNRDGKWSYAFSLSRRGATEGFIEGTPYSAYSLFAGLEFKLDPNSSLTAIAIAARNRRGRSAPITEEVFDLAGRSYNPHWGWQADRIRNARERIIEEPILMLNYHRIRERFRFRMGVAYQFGDQASGRLGYFQAPNPDPTYYRYLPSFAINNGFGDQSINAQRAAEAFRSGGQLNWEGFYEANENTPSGKASYVLYSDVREGKRFTSRAVANLKITRTINLDLGFTYKTQTTDNFARLDDLLGAQFHLDVDPFSDTQNDMDGPLEKEEGDRFSYNYTLDSKVFDGFLQVQLEREKWHAFASAGWQSSSYQREGLFKNARYSEESFGIGPKQKFTGLGLKAGLGYNPTARIRFNLRGLVREILPLPKNMYINPRDNQKRISFDVLPDVTSLELNTLLRFPKLTGRVSGYSTWFRNTSEIGFYYTDSGLGSDFVQEVLTKLNTRHRGLEFGLEYHPSSSVTLSLAGTLAAYQYVNNPNTLLYFDVTEADENPIDPSGQVDLGTARLKGDYLARGPQKAISLGVTYRAPKFWFVSTTINELSRNFVDLAILPRTESFFINPENGLPYSDVDQDFLGERFKQQLLPRVYLLNLVGGKSWLIKGYYLGIFASINNLLDETFRTGGFEQSRNGHYGQFVEDQRSLSPSFGPKYWYGFGRTYFLNLSLSF